MLNEYWPEEKQIHLCMNTEAEVAAEHVLLAVHEPMRLSKRQMNAVQGKAKTEHDLLQDLLNQSYPIPILGDAGSGKSHVVRWLDAKLKVHETCADWHIRRIPKGASLRQVLEILLDGLDGENFETIRAKVRKVGEGLKVEQVANLLITYIENALADLHDKEEAYCREIISTGKQVPKEERSRMDLLRRHAKPGRLAALVGDSTFKKRLIGEGKCIYQLAKRFTEGKTTKEFDKQTEEIIQVEDFDLLNNPDFGKFSHDAQAYIRHAGLSNHEKQTEAVKLLNEVLDDVQNKAFSNLYQVEGFTDLFTEIRRHLKQQNRTLVILVEDLAAISAIKDELLDNLLIQDIYDGEQELCSIRSVFAVTTESEGFKAFSSRRNTLGSRLGNTEWHIDNASINEADTMSRIQDFCGRYLNAARIGSNSLKQSYDALSGSGQWPSVWHSSESDDVDVVNQFGSSPRGYPLFPFNKKALEAMVHAHCYSSGRLQFVPRDIINRILKDVLINYRQMFQSNNFPNRKFLDAMPLSTREIATELKSSLNMKVDMSEHANALVAIWGYQAQDLNELLQAMPSEVARVFGENSLAEMLANISPDELSKPTPVINPTPTPTPHEKPVAKPTVVPEQHDRLKEIARSVDRWFASRLIEQGDAAVIRKVLLAALETAWKHHYSGWVAVADLPSSLKGKNNQPTIYIAFNMNNPAAELYFGNPPTAGSKFGDYGTDSIEYKRFLIALFRHEEYGHWKYTDGYADYCHYQNFIADWVKESLKVLIDIQRKTAEEPLKRSLQNALIFEPKLANKNVEDKLRFLCHAFKSSNDEKQKFHPAPGIESYLIKTPVSEWNELREIIATEWEENQNKWLKCFSPERNYAIEGDLLKSILWGALDPDAPVPKNVSRVVKSAQAEVKRDFKVLEKLKECKDEAEFIGTLTDLDALLKSLSDAGQYQNLQDGLSSKKMRNTIVGIIDRKSWPTAKALIELLGPFEVKKTISSLNNIDGPIANDLRDLLGAWTSQHVAAGGSLRKENHISGKSNTAEIKEKVKETIDTFGEVFSRLEELNNDKFG